MKLLKAGILALLLTMTTTVGLAADYEIFTEFQSVETAENHYSVERLDHKNKKPITLPRPSTPSVST